MGKRESLKGHRSVSRVLCKKAQTEQKNIEIVIITAEWHHFNRPFQRALNVKAVFDKKIDNGDSRRLKQGRLIFAAISTVCKKMVFVLT